jgi:hypothetical protein
MVSRLAPSSASVAVERRERESTLTANLSAQSDPQAGGGEHDAKHGHDQRQRNALAVDPPDAASMKRSPKTIELASHGKATISPRLALGFGALRLAGCTCLGALSFLRSEGSGPWREIGRKVTGHTPTYNWR